VKLLAVGNVVRLGVKASVVSDVGVVPPPMLKTWLLSICADATAAKYRTIIDCGEMRAK
jgi:hypothetical protein